MKMFYQIKNGSVSISGNVILEDIQFKIKNQEKIGLVGRNGCGKTTLLKAIMGEYPIEDGYDKVEVNSSKDFKIGYVEQSIQDTDKIKMIDYIRSAYSDILIVQDKLSKLEKRMACEYHEKDFNLLMSKRKSIKENYDWNNISSINSVKLIEYDKTLFNQIKNTLYHYFIF